MGLSDLISELVPSEGGELPDIISVSPEPPQLAAENIMKTLISVLVKYNLASHRRYEDIVLKVRLILGSVIFFDFGN